MMHVVKQIQDIKVLGNVVYYMFSAFFNVGCRINNKTPETDFGIQPTKQKSKAIKSLEKS